MRGLGDGSNETAPVLCCLANTDAARVFDEFEYDSGPETTVVNEKIQ